MSENTQSLRSIGYLSKEAVLHRMGFGWRLERRDGVLSLAKPGGMSRRRVQESTLADLYEEELVSIVSVILPGDSEPSTVIWALRKQIGGFHSRATDTDTNKG